MKRPGKIDLPPVQQRVSAANCGGLIEAMARFTKSASAKKVSAANCGGLIEARDTQVDEPAKERVSAANCGGLIEAFVRW